MRDTVVLADFRNRAGDTMFDDTLGEALGVRLRQSPFLNLLPEQQIPMTLQLMGRRRNEPHFTTVTRNQQKAGESYRLLLATYPNDYVAHVNLGSLCRDRNMPKEAVTELEEAVRLAPGEPVARTNLGFAYIA